MNASPRRLAVNVYGPNTNGIIDGIMVLFHWDREGRFEGAWMGIVYGQLAARQDVSLWLW